jgi:nucleotide-binding universal stress UspA family protein
VTAGLTNSAPEFERSPVSAQTKYEGTIRNILVPTDFSPGSSRALTKAVALAHQCKAAITLLYVMDLCLHTPPTGPANADQLKSDLEREGRERLGETIVKLRRERVELHPMVQEGPPNERICEAARRCDLIVMGKSKKPFWHLFSRRTVDAVLEKAPCPVLVVPAKESEPTF